MSASLAAGGKILFDVVVKAYERGWGDKLVDVFRRKNRVLVLGCTGAGKTQMLRSLSKIIPPAISFMNRTNYVEEHRLKISNHLFDFIDTPGDLVKKDIRMEAIKGALKKPVAAIINVVAYGYHEYRGKEADVFESDDRVKQSYLNVHRKEEIEQLHEWTGLLGDRDVGGQLLTVVSKADLWWNERKKVLDHYTTGAYFKAIGDAKDLNPGVVSYSAITKRFFGRTNTLASFDDTDRTDLRSQFFYQLFAAIGRADGNG